MSTKKPKAYSYIRFSTPDQARGDSLRRQSAAAASWCAERGLELDDTLRDLGVSAYRGTNRTMGALKHFLELVESGNIERGSYLIVESLDRLSREVVLDAAARLFDLIRAGVRVVTLSDGQEYSDERLRNDWTPLIVSIAVMARAHEESKVKGERVGAAWAIKKQAARDERRPLTKRCPEWLVLEHGAYVERPERVAIIRRIFRETIQGAGRREIVKRLNEEGIPAFRGRNGWHTSSIAKVLQARTVLGEYQPHSGTHRSKNRQADGEPITGYYPAVIDEGTFWQAQAAIDGRRIGAAGRRGQQGAHILRGLAKCGTCGAAMHVINKGRPPKGGVYFACSAAIRKTGCSNARRWRVNPLEQRLLAALGYIEARAYDALETSRSSEIETLTALTGKLADAEKRRERLLTLVEIGDETATSRFGAVAAEVKAIKKDLQVVKADLAKAAADPGVADQLSGATALLKRMAIAEPAELRDLRIRLGELLRGMVDRVECQEGGAVMIMKPRLNDLIYLSGRPGFALHMARDEPIKMLIEDEVSEDIIQTFMMTGQTWVAT